jgi:type II secretory pathway component PulF
MPQFKWRGVTLEGTWLRGTSYALSAEHLDEQLIRRGISCTQYTELYTRFWRHTISYEDQVTLFDRLATLLNAGIRVPEAWAFVAQYASKPYLHHYLHYIAMELRQGSSLRDILHAKYSPFSNIVVELLCVGHEAGSLAKAVESIVHYVGTVRIFQNSVRTALFMPCITGIFVLVLIIAIFIYVVPYMATLCTSCNIPLPHTIQTMMLIDAYLKSWCLIVGLTIIFSCIIALRYYMQHSVRWHYLRDQIYMSLPCIRVVIKEWYITTTMRALACLLDSGITLPQALKIMQHTVSPGIVQREIAQITSLVEEGVPLSDALAATHSGLFESELIAMVAVGQETNKLAQFLGTIATTYHKRMDRRLHHVSLCIQPVVISLLGIIVTMLIITVYMPIIQMAQSL